MRSELAKAKRKINQLKRCLYDVEQLCYDVAHERHDLGRGDDEDPTFRILRQIFRRIHRTVKR
jgi:hypothetical protein